MKWGQTSFTFELSATTVCQTAVWPEVIVRKVFVRSEWKLCSNFSCNVLHVDFISAECAVLSGNWWICCDLGRSNFDVGSMVGHVIHSLFADLVSWLVIVCSLGTRTLMWATSILRTGDSHRISVLRFRFSAVGLWSCARNIEFACPWWDSFW